MALQNKVATEKLNVSNNIPSKTKLSFYLVVKNYAKKTVWDICTNN